MPYSKYSLLADGQTAALLGAVLVSMVEIFTRMFSPTSPAFNKKEVLRMGVETSFALFAAYISSLYVTPWIIDKVGLTGEHSINLIYMFVGLIFWKAAPAIILMGSKGLPAAMAKMFPFNISLKKSDEDDEPK